MRYRRSLPLAYALAAIALIAIFSLVSGVAKAQSSPPAAITPPAYTVTDLGPLPSVADDVSLGLNDNSVVSLWVQSPAGAIHAETWTKGKTNDLGSVAGYPTSIARAIDPKGRTAGWVVSGLNPVDSLATTQAFVYHGKMTLIGTLGGKSSRAYAVNSKGMVVGDSQTSSGDRHAFFFNGHKIADLGTLPGGSMSTADAINDSGHICGAAEASQNRRHAVLWKDGHIYDLGTLPQGTTSYATAINSRDQVAGFSETPDGVHAFLWDKGTMTDLGTLKDDPVSARAINDRAQVVGSASVGNYIMHAFLWQQGQIYDLNKLLSGQPGWQLIGADAINDSGQIACIGHQKEGPIHALLLTPITSSKGNKDAPLP